MTFALARGCAVELCLDRPVTCPTAWLSRGHFMEPDPCEEVYFTVFFLRLSFQT